MNAALEPRAVELRHLLTRRAVDKDRVWELVVIDVRRKAGEICRFAARVQLRAPLFEINRVIREQHPARTRQRAHAQVDVEFLLQTAKPVRQLAK